MLDWSKLFNIVFVATALALIMFFIVSTIVVAVKGKRKCNAFDVILRIVASIVLIAAAGMFACSVLTMLKGDFRISFTVGADGAIVPVFVMGAKPTELPLADLFVALATTVGSQLAALLLICSLVALIVDCLVANKKADKPAKAKANNKDKSPEQIKRDLELEKIRRIGDSAVKKTNSAASGKNRETTESVSRNVEQSPAEQTQAESQPDWREQQPQRSTEFVGLNNDNADDGFDSFDDDFTDGGDTTAEDAQADVTESVENTETTETTEYSEYSESVETDDEVYDEQSEYVDEYQADQTDEVIETDDATETVEGEDTEDLDAFIDEFFAEDGETAESDGERQSEVEDDEVTEYADAEQTEQVEDIDEQSDDDEAWYAQGNEGEYTDAVDAAQADEGADDENIEPNRDIYIPQMRTVVKDKAESETTTVTTVSVEQKTAVRTTESAKRADVESVAASKQSGGKRAAQTSGGAKRGAAKNAGKGAAKSKKTKAEIPAEKKLPVTRRYVILDRRNAVNMFGEYLKDRKQSDKDKLKSSINTIIIE